MRYILILFLSIITLSVFSQNFDRCEICNYPTSFESVDVFIILGQSNAEGVGDTIDLSVNDRLSDDSIQIWKNDNYTLEDYKPGTAYYKAAVATGGKHGVELGFGKYYAQQTGDSVYIFKVAQSGRFLCQQIGGIDWNVDATDATDLWNGIAIPSWRAFIAELYNQNKKPNIKAIVWFQGEQDSGDAGCRAVYLDNLTSLMYAIRNKFNTDNNVPAFICEINGSSTVKDDHETYSNTYSNTFYQLTTGVGYTRFDGVHLDSESLLLLASDIITIINSY